MAESMDIDEEIKQYQNLQDDMKKEKEAVNGQQIKVQHDGIKIKTFKELCDKGVIDCKTEFNLRENQKSDEINSGISKVCKDFAKYDPETFDDLLIYYKTVCALFLTQPLLTDTLTLQDKIDLLQKAFKMQILNWDYNPIILHLICKSLLEILDDIRNLIYFSKKISLISRTSFYIGVCLMWSSLYKILKIDIKMHRFHKLETLVEKLETKFNIDSDRLDDLYNILQIISFLQISIVHKKLPTDDPYVAYFQYTNNDLIKLKKWCEKIKQTFEFNVRSGNRLDYSLINDIIEFDILYMIQSALPQTNFTYSD